MDILITDLQCIVYSYLDGSLTKDVIEEINYYIKMLNMSKNGNIQYKMSMEYTLINYIKFSNSIIGKNINKKLEEEEKKIKEPASCASKIYHSAEYYHKQKYDNSTEGMQINEYLDTIDYKGECNDHDNRIYWGTNLY